MRFASLILAKSTSSRLPGKNTLDFNGEPMFMTNVRKCLGLFDDVYVSSDSFEILRRAERAGAKGIIRDEILCGDTPNIPVYQHALQFMGDVDGIVAVQANSPTISPFVIDAARQLLARGYHEVMTVHENGSIYGSVWGLSRRRLERYEDPYSPKPERTLVDPSVDIHTKEDYELCLSTLQ